MNDNAFETYCVHLYHKLAIAEIFSTESKDQDTIHEIYSNAG